MSHEQDPDIHGLDGNLLPPMEENRVDCSEEMSFPNLSVRDLVTASP